MWKNARESIAPAPTCDARSFRWYNSRAMELRYTVTDEDALNAFRVRSKQPWTMFLLVLLLALMFLVGIFLLTHDLVMIGWIWLALSAGVGLVVREISRAPLF